ncbi:hypothetical protein [Streptomyces hesseae]|uniref:Alcohol dehydrogenase-like C-terminal domain-containing protein n=1 Tax=Streptomyces hesseae TaxID=3075519 RepID=A0ABU2SLN4_9ACTN|nr:hypothetical protein [Streptomyces sp. DSM 40473]MDT0449269.1 hypothetical protein [Streptomyces sp. DSM 40473]
MPVWSGGGFEGRVRELTGGRGADVVYDGGVETFHSSQLALRPHGVHAYYGPFMGVPALRPTDLPNSILLTYPVMHHHVPTALDADREAAALLAGVQGGVVILMTTGGIEHLEAAPDRDIAHLRKMPAVSLA